MCMYLTKLLPWLLLLQAPVLPTPAQSLTYTTSWLGNSFGGTAAPGQPRKHVPLSIDGLLIEPDGTCLTNSGWDEDGCEASFFKNGDVVGSAAHTHGWGYAGGAEIAANSRYLFLLQTVDSEGGGLVAADTWPAKGRRWFGVSRRRPGGGAAPFPGGLGGHGDTLRRSFLRVGETADVSSTFLTGLAADSRHLYISNSGVGEITVYDPETMVRIRGWPLPRPGRIALAADGSLWIIQRGDAAHTPRLVHRTPDGRVLGAEIMDVASPSALCADSRGRLLVTDDGPAQQVRIYEVLGPAPRLVGKLGIAGGIFAGTGRQIGLDGPQRFNHLTGIGTDAAGNITVASNASAAGGGAVLESYTPTGKRNWRLLGLEFIDTPDADPSSDGRDVYTKEEHFTLDYTHRKPGSEWTYQGYTIDRFRYPDDPRLHTSPTSAFVRRIEGKLFLFTTDMVAGMLTISRFDPAKRGEVAIPVGCFAKQHEKGDWPPSQPETGEWIWRDVNGDGAMQAGEYLSRPSEAPSLWGWWVDSRGDVWQATDRDGLRHFPCGGLDEHGCPRYSYAAMQTIPMPDDFAELCRIDYLPQTDTMFLAGYTKSHPHLGGEWGAAGTEVLRYDGWRTGNRQPALKIMLPSDGKQDAQLFIKALCVSGDYLFAAESRSPERVFVYNIHTGKFAGTMQPGTAVGKSSGWIDTPYGICAFRLTNGEYEIFTEEDLDAKIILYRWKPKDAGIPAVEDEQAGD